MIRGLNNTPSGPVIQTGSGRLKLSNPYLPELGWAKVKLSKKRRTR